MRPSHWGSSPLARGTLVSRNPLETVVGLIPARAGNTPPRQQSQNPTLAHPRSRGEHPAKTAVAEPDPGSSPLARGTREGFSCEALEVGLIPARAGNTQSTGMSHRGRWAHPRSRGEHLAGRWRRRARSGSSPLARGTPSGAVGGGYGDGLIPARAGNTLAR